MSKCWSSRRSTAFRRQRRRTLFERDVAAHQCSGTAQASPAVKRELILPTTLAAMSAASRLSEEIELEARWLRGINFVGFWPRRWSSAWRLTCTDRAAGGRLTVSDDFLVDVFDEAPSLRQHDSGAPAGWNRHQHHDLALAMLMLADLGVQCSLEVGRRRAPSPDRAGRRLRLVARCLRRPGRPLELGAESATRPRTWLGLDS